MRIFQDQAGDIQPGKEKVLLMLTGIFLVTFFFPGAPVINNIAILLLALHCFRYNTWREKMDLFRARPATWFIIAFYILQLISALISEDVSRGLQYLQVRIPLLLFPLSLGLVSLRDAVKTRMFFLYAGITTLAAIVCLISALVVYAKTGDTGFLYNDSLTDITKKQSVYFALMVNIAIFSFAWLIYKNAITKLYRSLAIVSIIFLMIFHFMLASRMEILFLYTTAVLTGLYYFFISRKNYRLGLALIGCLIVCAGVFVIAFPKTINRFNELMYPDYNMKSDAVESHYNMELNAEQWNGFNIRLAIWDCAWPMIQSNLTWGTGIGDKDNELLKAYEKREFKFGIKTNKNMHNTYLDVLSGMGIIGLFVFLTGFVIIPLITCIRLSDLLSLLILVDFMLSFITETYPDRSLGNILLGFFTALLLSYSRRPEEAI